MSDLETFCETFSKPLDEAVPFGICFLLVKACPFPVVTAAPRQKGVSYYG